MKRGSISQGDFSPNPNTRQRREANGPVPPEASVIGTHERQGSEATRNTDLASHPINAPLPVATEPNVVALASVGVGNSMAPGPLGLAGAPSLNPVQFNGPESLPDRQGQEEEEEEYFWFTTDAEAEQSMLARFQRPGPEKIGAHLLNDHRQHEAVFSKVAQDSRVTRLHISTDSNTLKQDYSGEALYAAIRKNGLREFSLHGLKLDDAGWALLGQALASNTSLQAINLEFDRVSKEQLRHLVNGLIANQSVRTFRIECAKLKSGCSNELYRLLKENRTIQRLCLGWTVQIQREDFLRMIDGLSGNHALQELRLDAPEPKLNLSDVARVIRALNGAPRLRAADFGALCLNLAAARDLARFLATSPLHLPADDFIIPGPVSSHRERERVGLQLCRTGYYNKKRMEYAQARSAYPDTPVPPLELDDILQAQLPPSFKLPDDM